MAAPTTISQWAILESIGTGGNADVWLATDGQQEVALKVLKTKQPDSERYLRFRNEIEVLRRLGDDPGILPVIDASLPARPTRSDRAWIAMPRATLIRQALADAPLREVVGAIADIAATLGRVAERGIAHRDLKPENLYSYEARWVVGDFGIAHVPDAGERRLTEKRLGPFGYMPDELIVNAAEADPFAVDVFQLAKCLLVLGGGLVDPPQGTIEAGSSGALSRWVVEPRCDALDGLIERCTRREPGQRPSMPDVARELAAWLNYASPAEPLDMAAVIATFRQANRASLDERAQADAYRVKLVELALRVDAIMAWVADSLMQAGLPPRRSGWHRMHELVERRRYGGMEPSLDARQLWITAELGATHWLPTKVAVGIGLDVDAKGEFWCAGIVAWGDMRSSATTHRPIEHRSANIESIEVDNVLAELSHDIQALCLDMLTALASTN